MWETLLIAIVGGLLATLGQVATPIVNHVLSKKIKSEERKRDQALQALEALAELDAYVQAMININAWGHDIAPPSSPAWKIRTTVGMHFPDLDAEILQFNLSLVELEKWTIDAGLRRLHGKIDQIKDDFLSAYQPWYLARNSLEDRLVGIAREWDGKA
ncbi:hypothetical protein SAMN06297468_2519 [Altererythrobacter xiamenensis]|uniref:Uncharacterized protein n=1 Tax=Altererythrobacter xiamenensis TaxID=1316679 RepID=A0A1Y6FH19_9SPHN|nr:hypothetical protein [Altererythrobacter xiamenensis]SMQ74288.1 hypothetical protein SAMN06297468_2519 [Altererythrobacter xiamenensis]